MKAIVITIVLVFLFFTALSGQESTEVILRFSKDQNILRIVMESDERFVIDANTIITQSSIKIEFPDHFLLTRPDDFIFETLKTGRLLTIYVNNIEDARAFKLFSPPRLVIDLDIAEDSVGLTPYPPLTEEYEERFIVINPGHGGYDFGITSEHAREKDINLTIAKNLAAELSETGARTSLVRDDDQFLSLHNRILKAEKENPDLFISIHSSLSDMFVIYLGTSNEPSSETLYKRYALHGRQSRHIVKSRKLAEKIQNALKRSFLKTVAIRELPLPVLNSIDAPAIMMEYPTPKLNTYDERMIGSVNRAIVEAIEEYDD